MNLKITTQNGFIGINTAAGKMNIDYGKSNFKLQTKKPQIDMQISQPKVKIDLSKPLEEIGLSKIDNFIKANAQKYRQAALSGIKKIASQGNELAMIETGSNVIASQAQYNAFDQNKKEVNIGFIPKSRPKIELEEGKVSISLQKGKVDIQNKPQDVNLNFNRGKVEIYLRQNPSIDIEYIGNGLDFKI